MPTLASLLCDHYTAVPERTALHLLFPKQAPETLTYHTLITGAAQYAQAYAAAGIQPGEVVVLILQHSAALIYAFYGAILHGAIPTIMPFLTEKLAPEKYRQELTALVTVTRPTAIVTYPAFEAEVHTAIRNGAASDWVGQTSVRAVLLNTVIEQLPRPAPALSQLAGLARTTDDIVLLQHSSGTTGLQKGVALSNQAVLNQLEAYGAAIGLDSDDVVVSWLPLYHDMGLIAGFLMPVLERVPLVLLSPFDWVRAPAQLLQAVSRYHGTLTWLPNFAYNFCAQRIRPRDLEGVDLSSWRAVINCSEPMRWESHQAFYAKFAPYGLRPSALRTCYAMAENVFAVTQGGFTAPVTVDIVDRRALIVDKVAQPVAADTPNAVRMLSAGQPLPNVRVRVLTEPQANGTRTELPERQVGEIVLQSDCMLTGYYNRPDATEKAFYAGWYLTGDLGYLANGELFVSGRKKDVIIVAGKNVYPQDLEALASEVPGVHPGRVVVFGLFDADVGTEDVVVVAEADTEDEEARNALAEEIRLHINRGSDVVARLIQIVGPRWVLKTSSGKVARAANREKYLAERAEVAA